MRLGPSAAVTESIPASILDGLTLEAVEWLPSGADTGLLRVRGRWAVGVAHPLGLPVLCASVGGAVSRVDSLPDAPSTRTNGSVWRGAYLVPEAVARAGPVARVGERRALRAADARGAGRARRSAWRRWSPSRPSPSRAAR